MVEPLPILGFVGITPGAAIGPLGLGLRILGDENDPQPKHANDQENAMDHENSP
jgi:hypothetical protein